MKITAQSSREASKQILRIILIADLKRIDPSRYSYGFFFIYYNTRTAYYSIESLQRKDTTGLVKRYNKIDLEDIINVTATQYRFAEIAIGAILSRKIMNYREFFNLVNNHFEWLK